MKRKIVVYILGVITLAAAVFAVVMSVMNYVSLRELRHDLSVSIDTVKNGTDGLHSLWENANKQAQQISNDKIWRENGDWSLSWLIKDLYEKTGAKRPLQTLSIGGEYPARRVSVTMQAPFVERTNVTEPDYDQWRSVVDFIDGTFLHTRKVAAEDCDSSKADSSFIVDGQKFLSFKPVTEPGPGGYDYSQAYRTLLKWNDVDGQSQACVEYLFSDGWSYGENGPLPGMEKRWRQIMETFKFAPPQAQ